MDPTSIPAVLDLAKALNISVDEAVYVSIAVLLAALLVSLLVIRLSLGGKKRDTVLLLGLCGAGKTSLFYQLRDGTRHGGTVTSMEPNEGCFPLHSPTISKSRSKPRPVHVVDLPGHPRLRPKVDAVLPHTRAIVFVIDALDFMPNLRANAEFLYEVLTKRMVASRKIPVLLACNKMDKVTAHSVDFIRKQLEKEIDKLRASRSAISDADLTSEVLLGTEGESFKFTQCANKVSAVEASVKENNLKEIEAFIREQVK
eukprot:jgi/Mesen1/5770/ME000292S04832